MSVKALAEKNGYAVVLGTMDINGHQADMEMAFWTRGQNDAPIVSESCCRISGGSFFSFTLLLLLVSLSSIW